MFSLLVDFYFVTFVFYAINECLFIHINYRPSKCKIMQECVCIPSYSFHISSDSTPAYILTLSKRLCVTPQQTGGGHNSDVYRSFRLCWIYFYKSIQICFCAAYCTRGVNVLYKVFRSGIRFPPQFHQSILGALRGIHHFDSCR